MRRTISLLAALALAATASLLDAPAFGYTAPEISAIDHSVPGHASFTVSGTDAPYISTFVVSVAEDNAGGTDLPLNRYWASTVPAGNHFDLPTWGVETAKVVVMPCSSSTAESCATSVTSDVFFPDDVIPELSLPLDTTIGPADTYAVGVSDPDGGGTLYARWGSNYTWLNHNGSTNIPLTVEGAVQEEILRCTGNACRSMSAPRTVTVNRVLSSGIYDTSDLGAISPALGSMLEPRIRLDEAQDQTFTLNWVVEDTYGQAVPGFSGVIHDLTADESGILRPRIDPSGLADTTSGLWLRAEISYADPDFGTLTRRGLGWRFTIDSQPLAITKVGLSSPVVMPYSDDYKDSTDITVVTDGGAGRMVIRIANSSDRVVWQRTDWSSPGGTKFRWKGRSGAGEPVPAGVYTIDVLLKDAAGNPSTHTGTTIQVVRKRLVGKGFHKTVTAAGSMVKRHVGECSSLAQPSSRGWAGSLGYYSNTKCSSGFYPSAVETDHAMRVPRGATYGLLRVSAFGGASTAEPRSVAYISYRLLTEYRWSEPSMLMPGLGWQYSDRGDGTYMVTPKRWIMWAVFNVKGSRYDVKSFKVSLRYSVLVPE